MLVLTLGLRSNHVGEDTNHYIDIFYKSKYISWNKIVNSQFKTIWYIDQFGYADSIENGFLILTKVVRTVTANAQIYLLIISAITFGNFGKFIYDNSKRIFMSMYILMCECIYMSAFNGIRQMLALSIGIHAYTLLKKNRRVSAIFCILLAAYIHNSALIYVLIFPIMMKKFQREYKWFKFIIAVGLATPVMLPLIKQIVSYILPRYAAYFVNNYWEANLGGTIALWIIELLLILHMYRSKFTQLDSFGLSAFSFIYLVLDCIGLQITAISRLALYFRFFLVLFFPKALQSIRSKYIKRVLKYGLYILMTIAFLSYAKMDSRAYEFFLK